MSNITSVTNYFATANEGFSTSLGSTISAGAAIIPITNTSGLTNGSIFVGLIDPGVSGKEQAFTGTVDTTGSQITGVIWTKGSNVAHTGGATIVDYVTSTAFNMLSTGVQKHANQDGSLKQSAVKTALGVTSDPTGGWSILSTVPTTATGYNKGNKEFELVFQGVDVRTTLSPDMRAKVDRTGTVPTQSTKLVRANSQYWTKSSPAGITFTDDFTVEAWVKLESYAGIMGVIGQFNGTNGWLVRILTSGQLNIYGSNGTSKEYTTYQSIPLNQWVHIALTLDMSGSVSTTYINGASVSNFVTGTGTALTQAGNLQVGAYNSTNFFDGSISQVRVWSTIRTATQIRDNMATSTVGNETGLVADFKFSGNANDSTANANNLTASGGAVSTSVDNPFKTTEYAEILSVSYSSPNSVVVVRTPDGYSIPNMTLQNFFYSTSNNPYGYPSKSKMQTVLTNTQGLSGALGDWPGQSITITTKAGREYLLEFSLPYLNPSVASALNTYITDGSNNILNAIRTNTPSGESTGFPSLRARYVSPLGGQQTFKVRAIVDTGTVTANTSIGGFCILTVDEK